MENRIFDSAISLPPAQSFQPPKPGVKYYCLNILLWEILHLLCTDL